jgi:tight adherence protein C
LIAAAGSLVTLVTLAGAVSLLFAEEEPSEEVAAHVASPMLEAAPPSRVVMALQSLSSPDEESGREELRLALIQGGFRGPNVVERLLAMRTVLTVVIPAMIFAVASTWSTLLGLLMLLGAGVGYFSPLWFARSRQSERQVQLSRAVPNIMDMLVSCLEAGLGIDAALQYAAREIRVASPPLADELDHTNAEMSAGIPRLVALKRLDRRTGVKELSSLVNLLGQAEKFGAGAAQGIRAQAKLSRQRRTLDAERRAAEAAPKLTVAMIIFILPPLFVVLLGPSAVQVMQSVYPDSAW